MFVLGEMWLQRIRLKRGFEALPLGEMGFKGMRAVEKGV